MSHENDGKKIEGHDYDGIEELDHAPPNWFQALFLVSILFAIGYWFHYEFGTGDDQLTEYTRALRSDEYLRLASQEATPTKALAEEDLLLLVKDEPRRKLGHASYQSKCASCHGTEGQGGIGPNLTDPYWLHGGKMTEVLTTISNGVLDKGMPAWGPMLPQDEIQALTVYVRTLAGTRPSGAKAPQGNLIKEE